MSIVLRSATAADLPTLVAMRDQLNRLELSGSPQAPIQRLSVEAFTRLWGHTLENPDYCWRIVERDRRPIGFGLLYLIPKSQPPGAFLHWAYLEEGHRRLGLGQRLFDELLTWASGKGANRIELRYIDGNESARNFWTKMGFQPFARQCVRYLEPT
jgi:GNAT superfamily N-acetyltransferase